MRGTTAVVLLATPVRDAGTRAGLGLPARASPAATPRRELELSRTALHLD
jgi:hypothetical protein